MTEPKQTLEERWNLMIQEQGGKDLTEQDQEDLWRILQSPVFVRAAVLVMQGAELEKNQLLQLNLGDPVQAHLGSKVQGSVIAQMNVFNKLIAYCKEKEKENENK